MFWTISSIANSIGMVFLSLRGIFPDIITVVIANTLIIAAIGILASGIEIFIGSARRAWIYIVFVLFLFISFMYFTYYSPNISARIIIISVMIAILYGYCGYILHRNFPKNKVEQNTLLVAVLYIIALWHVFRTILTVFLDIPIIDFMQASAIHGVSLVVLLSGNIFVIIGLITLNLQRVENELFTTMKEVKKLKGIVPICMHCKGIRDDKGYWNQIEKYITEHSDAQLSHGVCDECLKKYYPDL
jgi:hypothetical protein